MYCRNERVGISRERNFFLPLKYGLQLALSLEYVFIYGIIFYPRGSVRSMTFFLPPPGIFIFCRYLYTNRFFHWFPGLISTLFPGDFFIYPPPTKVQNISDISPGMALFLTQGFMHNYSYFFAYYSLFKNFHLCVYKCYCIKGEYFSCPRGIRIIDISSRGVLTFVNILLPPPGIRIGDISSRGVTYVKAPDNQRIKIFFVNL